MVKKIITTSLQKTIPSHRKRRVMGRQRRTLETGAISTKNSWNNTNECRSKKSLVSNIKEKEMKPNSKNNGRR
jgi:hypothetical protein